LERVQNKDGDRQTFVLLHESESSDRNDPNFTSRNQHLINLAVTTTTTTTATAAATLTVTTTTKQQQHEKGSNKGT